MQINKESAKLNLAEILDLITNVEEDNLDDQLKRIEHTQTLLEIVETSTLMETFDIQFTCDKTGKPVGTWSLDQLRRLQLTIGNDRAKELIRKKQREQITPEWIFTDPQALEKLIEVDPVGFFVYATNFIIPVNINFKDMLPDEKQLITDQRHCEKAVLWQQLQDIPINELAESNEIMRRYLSLIKTRRAMKIIIKAQTSNIPDFFTFTMITIANSVERIKLFRQGLKNILREMIVEEYRRNRIKTHISYADVVNLKLRYEGYTQFQSMRRFKLMTPVEHVLMELEEFIPPTITDMAVMEQVKFDNKKSGVKGIIIKTKTSLKLEKAPKKSFHVSFATALARKV